MKRMLLSAAAAVAVTVVTPTAAIAAPVDMARPQFGCTAATATYSNIHSVADETRSPSGPDWQVSGSGVTLSLSKSVSIANTFTGSVSPPSSSLGFSTSKTTTTTMSATYNVPQGQTWVLRADTVFQVKAYDYKITKCAGAEYGSGKAYNFIRLNYRTYRI